MQPQTAPPKEPKARAATTMQQVDIVQVSEVSSIVQPIVVEDAPAPRQGVFVSLTGNDDLSKAPDDFLQEWPDSGLYKTNRQDVVNDTQSRPNDMVGLNRSEERAVLFSMIERSPEEPTSPTKYLARKTSIPRLTPRFVSNPAKKQTNSPPTLSPTTDKPSYIPRMVSKSASPTSPTTVNVHHTSTTASEMSYQHQVHTRSNNVTLDREYYSHESAEKVRIYVPYGHHRITDEMEERNKVRLQVSSSSQIEVTRESKNGHVLPAVDT